MFFRDSAARLARQLALSGFIRNEPGGSVYLEAEGDAGKLNELIKWCQTGPRYAAVDKVNAKQVNPTGETGFRIE